MPPNISQIIVDSSGAQADDFQFPDMSALLSQAPSNQGTVTAIPPIQFTPQTGGQANNNGFTFPDMSSLLGRVPPNQGAAGTTPPMPFLPQPTQPQQGMPGSQPLSSGPGSASSDYSANTGTVSSFLDTDIHPNIKTATYTPPGSNESQEVYVVVGKDGKSSTNASYVFKGENARQNAIDFAGYVAAVAEKTFRQLNPDGTNNVDLPNERINTFGADSKDLPEGSPLLKMELKGADINLAVAKLPGGFASFGAEDRAGIYSSLPIHNIDHNILRTITPDAIAQIQAYDEANFMGEGIPSSNKDLKYYATNPFATTVDGKPLDSHPKAKDIVGIQMGGLSATANSLYDWNYPQGLNKHGDTMPLLDLNSLDADVVDMLQTVFRKEDGFNGGHLNTLAMLKLASTNGKGSADLPANWELTKQGQEVKSTIEKTGENPYLSDLSLSAEQARILSQNFDLDSLISGGAEGGFSFKTNASNNQPFTVNDVKSKIKSGFDFLTDPKKDVPTVSDLSGVTVDAGVNGLLKFAFDSTEQTTDKLNTLIGAGLAQYSPENKTVSLTSKGEWLNGEVNKAPPSTPAAPEAPAPLTPGKAVAKALAPLASGYKNLFDYHKEAHDTEVGKREDDVISIRSIQAFAMGNFDQISPGHLNVTESIRQDIQRIAQQFFDSSGNLTDLGKNLIDQFNPGLSGLSPEQYLDTTFTFGNMQDLIFAEIIQPEGLKPGVNPSNYKVTLDNHAGVTSGSVTFENVDINNSSTWWVPQ